MKPIRIEGENMILRSVDSSDIDTILLWENSSNEPMYGVYNERYSRDDVKQFVDNQQNYSLEENEQLRLMICSLSGERLGALDLTEYDGKKANVSILIFDLYNRRNGLGSEALRLLISYAKSLDLQCLSAAILPENSASISLFEKMGFVKESGNRFLLLL